MTTRHATPVVAQLDLSRFSNCIGHLQESLAACEHSINALADAQQSLKPGPIERGIGVLECDVAVCLDNQAFLINQLKELIDQQIQQAETMRMARVGGDVA